MVVEQSHLILPSYLDELELAFVGDMHVGARACHEARIEHDLSKIKRRITTYIIYQGDQVDAIVPKDPRRFNINTAAPWTYDTLWPPEEEEPFEVNAVIDRQVYRVCQLLEVGPTDRVLGICDGNHEIQYLNYHSHDITRRIADKYNWKMLGRSYFLTLVVGFQDHPRTFQFTIYGHHGWGGGSRTEGYNLTKYSRQLPYFNAIIYAFAHVHDTQTKIIPRLRPMDETEWHLGKHTDERIHYDDCALIVTGTYLKTVSKGRTPTYSEDHGYPPRKLGYASALCNFDVETGEIHIGYAVR